MITRENEESMESRRVPVRIQKGQTVDPVGVWEE